MTDIHIPHVESMFLGLLLAKKQSDKSISWFRGLIRSAGGPNEELREIFVKTGIEEEIKNGLVKLSIVLGDAENLVAEINSSSAKRGRKFRHWQRKLEEMIAKVHKVYDKHLQTHSLWTKGGGLWEDIPE